MLICLYLHLFIWTLWKEGDFEINSKFSIVRFYSFYENEWLDEGEWHLVWSCMVYSVNSSCIRQWGMHKGIKRFICLYCGKSFWYLNTSLHTKNIQTPTVYLLETVSHLVKIAASRGQCERLVEHCLHTLSP